MKFINLNLKEAIEKKDDSPKISKSALDYVPATYRKEFWKVWSEKNGGELVPFYESQKASVCKPGYFGSGDDYCRFFLYTLDTIEIPDIKTKTINKIPNKEGRKSVLLCPHGTQLKDIEYARKIDPEFVEYMLELTEGNIQFLYSEKPRKYNPAQYTTQDLSDYINKGKANAAIELSKRLGFKIDTDQDVEVKHEPIEETNRRILNKLFREKGQIINLELYNKLGLPVIPFRHNFINRENTDVKDRSNYIVDPNKFYFNLKKSYLFKDFEQYSEFLLLRLDFAENPNIEIPEDLLPYVDSIPRSKDNSKILDWGPLRATKKINRDDLKNAITKTKKYIDGGYNLYKNGILDEDIKIIIFLNFTITGSFLDNGEKYKWNIKLEFKRGIRGENEEQVQSLKPFLNIETSEIVELPEKISPDTDFTKFNFLSVKEIYNGISKCLDDIDTDVKNIDFNEFLAHSLDFESNSSLNENRKRNKSLIRKTLK